MIPASDPDCGIAKRRDEMVSRRHLFSGIALGPLAGVLAGCGKLSTRKPTAVEQAPGRREFAPPLSGRETLRQRYFPNLTLVSSAGRQLKFYDDLLKDKIVILNFMYATCQGVCPTILANLMKVRKILDQEVNKEIFIYSLTVQPEIDTPDKLQEYAEMHRIRDSRWLFLTGNPGDVDALRHLLGFADPNPEVDKDKSRHTGMIRYGNEPLSIWGTCQGSGEPGWIAQEIQFAVPREFKRNPRVND
jgi:protein SCO1/2